MDVPVSVLEAMKGLDVAIPEYSWMAMVPSAIEETWKDDAPSLNDFDDLGRRTAR